MKITFDKEFVIIPVYAGSNKDDNPIKATFRYLTSPERDECIKMDYVTIDGVAQRRTNFDYSRLLELSLLSLENCEVNGVKITKAKELISCEGISGLRNELGDRAAARNINPDLKN